MFGISAMRRRAKLDFGPLRWGAKLARVGRYAALVDRECEVAAFGVSLATFVGRSGCAAE